jgi:hypothetical protein
VSIYKQSLMISRSNSPLSSSSTATITNSSTITPMEPSRLSIRRLQHRTLVPWVWRRRNRTAVRFAASAIRISTA